jgi:hypothetical protein
MKRLLLITLILCLTLMGLCFASIERGRVEPTPEIVQGFGWCEDRLCYMGIVPGRTSWQGAKTILASTSRRIQTVSDWHVVADADDARIIMEPNPGGSTVQYISILSTATLGSIIAIYGSPCTTFSLNGAFYQTIYPSAMLVTAPVPRDRWLRDPREGLDPYWRVQIDLADGGYSCDLTNHKPWRGFAARRFYDP